MSCSWCGNNPLCRGQADSSLLMHVCARARARVCIGLLSLGNNE